MDEGSSSGESDSSEACDMVDQIPVAELAAARETSTAPLPTLMGSSTVMKDAKSAATLSKDASKKASKILKPSLPDLSLKSSPEWDSVFEPFPESFKEHLYRQRRRTKLEILKI
jgi:hypothetical protein